LFTEIFPTPYRKLTVAEEAVEGRVLHYSLKKKPVEGSLYL
jgi:hypothetical protein